MPLQRSGEILRFLSLAEPLACLIGASMGVAQAAGNPRAIFPIELVQERGLQGVLMILPIPEPRGFVVGVYRLEDLLQDGPRQEIPDLRSVTALSMVLASALLTGIGTAPARSEMQASPSRSRAPITLQADQGNLPAATTRTRSIAPAAIEASGAGIDTSSRSRMSKPAN